MAEKEPNNYSAVKSWGQGEENLIENVICYVKRDHQLLNKLGVH